MSNRMAIGLEPTTSSSQTKGSQVLQQFNSPGKTAKNAISACNRRCNRSRLTISRRAIGARLRAGGVVADYKNRGGGPIGSPRLLPLDPLDLGNGVGMGRTPLN